MIDPLGPTETSSKEDRLFKVLDKENVMSNTDPKLFNIPIFFWEQKATKSEAKMERVKPEWKVMFVHS